MLVCVISRLSNDLFWEQLVVLRHSNSKECCALFVMIFASILIIVLLFGCVTHIKKCLYVTCDILEGKTALVVAAAAVYSIPMFMLFLCAALASGSG